MRKAAAAVLSLVLTVLALLASPSARACAERRATCRPMACCEQPVRSESTLRAICCPEASPAIAAQPEPPLPNEESGARVLPPAAQPLAIGLAAPVLHHSPRLAGRRATLAGLSPHLARSPVLRI